MMISYLREFFFCTLKIVFQLQTNCIANQIITSLMFTFSKFRFQNTHVYFYTKSLYTVFIVFYEFLWRLSKKQFNDLRKKEKKIFETLEKINS